MTVDGIVLTRSSNIINDLFTGYEVNILSVTNSSGSDVPVNLSSAVDVNSAKKNLQSFVDPINIARRLLNEKTFRGLPNPKPLVSYMIQLLKT